MLRRTARALRRVSDAWWYDGGMQVSAIQRRVVRR